MSLEIFLLLTYIIVSSLCISTHFITNTLPHNATLFVDNNFEFNMDFLPSVLSLIVQSTMLILYICSGKYFIYSSISVGYLALAYRTQNEIGGIIGIIILFYELSQKLCYFMPDVTLNNSRRLISFVMANSFIIASLLHVPAEYIAPFSTAGYIILPSLYYYYSLNSTSIRSNGFNINSIIDNGILLISFTVMIYYALFYQVYDIYIENDAHYYFNVGDILIPTIIFGNLYVSQKIDEIATTFTPNYKLYTKPICYLITSYINKSYTLTIGVKQLIQILLARLNLILYGLQ